jgi:hypothetical protein
VKKSVRTRKRLRHARESFCVNVGQTLSSANPALTPIFPRILKGGSAFSGSLLSPQRLHRLQRRRAASRQIAGRECSDKKNQSHQGQR